MNKDCDICVAVNSENVFLLQTDLWSVVLANDQAYLGRCFVTAKRHVASMSELTHEEWQDYIQIVKKLESATTEAFGAGLHNWNCLMNNAFQKEPSLPHVHWHFRPRYKNNVEFAGETFDDPYFAHHYRSDYKKLVSNEVLEQIKSKLSENFKD
jgi:diadenosine tetraphosphate (Ap4A) HIT family hydrolase